jgi:hypothetical protein
VTTPNPQPLIPNPQRNTVLALVMAFVVALLLIQLWLLVGAVEGVLRAEGTIAFPATLVSGLCFLGVWQLGRRLWHRF